MSSWFLLQSGADGYAFNMALDEALLEAVPQLGWPVLRFYGWTERAASFGYFQKIADVERATLLRPLVRRPTGGGVVPHDADWTYSITIPTGHEWHRLKAIESYRRVHEWVQEAFVRLKIATELAPEQRTAAPGMCFAGHEAFDLLWRHRKVAGAAQRRTKAGLLIQGSVQPPELALSRMDWQGAMRNAGKDLFGIKWSPMEAGAALQDRAEQLAMEKYSRPEHNRKR